MPVMVKARNWVISSASEVVTLIADEARGWSVAHELAVGDLHRHEAAGWSFGRGTDRDQHPVAVEVVDLLQLGQNAGARRLGPGGAESLDEQAGRLPPVGGEDVRRLAPDGLVPLVEEL